MRIATCSFTTAGSTAPLPPPATPLAQRTAPAPQTPIAAAAVTAAASTTPAAPLGDETDEVRTVGGQFFSDAPSQVIEERVRSRGLLPATGGAVTIVPLEPTDGAESATAAPAAAPARTSSAATSATTGG